MVVDIDPFMRGKQIPLPSIYVLSFVLTTNTFRLRLGEGHREQSHCTLINKLKRI
jgi:hypothetical protein